MKIPPLKDFKPSAAYNDLIADAAARNAKGSTSALTDISSAADNHPVPANGHQVSRTANRNTAGSNPAQPCGTSAAGQMTTSVVIGRGIPQFPSGDDAEFTIVDDLDAFLAKLPKFKTTINCYYPVGGVSMIRPICQEVCEWHIGDPVCLMVECPTAIRRSSWREQDKVKKMNRSRGLSLSGEVDAGNPPEIKKAVVVKPKNRKMLSPATLPMFQSTERHETAVS